MGLEFVGTPGSVSNFVSIKSRSDQGGSLPRKKKSLKIRVAFTELSSNFLPMWLTSKFELSASWAKREALSPGKRTRFGKKAKERNQSY